jgi:hypothetical protein
MGSATVFGPNTNSDSDTGLPSGSMVPRADPLVMTLILPKASVSMSIKAGLNGVGNGTPEPDILNEYCPP